MNEFEDLNLDPTCPRCGNNADDGNVWMYMTVTCLSCGAKLFAQEISDTDADFVEIIRLPWQGTVKQRNQARKRRRGWR